MIIVVMTKLLLVSTVQNSNAKTAKKDGKEWSDSSKDAAQMGTNNKTWAPSGVNA